MNLSEKALQLLNQLFGEASNLQLPVGLAAEIIEIRLWAQTQLPKK